FLFRPRWGRRSSRTRRRRPGRADSRRRGREPPQPRSRQRGARRTEHGRSTRVPLSSAAKIPDARWPLEDRSAEYRDKEGFMRTTRAPGVILAAAAAVLWSAAV